MATVPAIGRAATVASATDATERLYARHHRKVYAFCLYQLRDRDDAAEAAQTTYMHALTALRRGVDPAFELPWLISIARNVCRTKWDAGKRRRRIELVRDPHDLANLAPAPETGELVGIEDALGALPEPQRRALVLREWHGLSYQEIADELEVSLSAVETMIFRGRRTLAQELGADEKGRRSFGIGSLLGGLKSGVGGSLSAKVAVGVVAAVGVGVTAAQELAKPSHTRAQRPTHTSAVLSAPGALAAAPLSAPPRRGATRVVRAGRAHKPLSVHRAARVRAPTTLPPRPK
ncbi:MAG: RNA polymerase sigma factor, partial [Thermoleophilia bacterium]|nr:RNA polymerase sigma factor [Thermoleophilia bacterium]